MLENMDVMKKILLLLILAMQTFHSVNAQPEQVKDTLDWRGYYPLEIGNVWEWHTHMPGVWFGGDADFFDHREIVADTMINDQPYFVMQAYTIVEFEVGEERNVYPSRSYLRYDTLQTRVASYDLALGDEVGACDLSADFNSIAACYEGLDMWAGGGYAADNNQLAIGMDLVPYKAVKEFGPGLTGGSIYYYGIGGLPTFGDGASGTIEFTYVKIGEQEYGTRGIRVGVEEWISREESAVTIYPNPVKSVLSLLIHDRLQGIEVRVIDMLGRSTPVDAVCEEKKCDMDVSSLRSGIYVLRYSGVGEKYGSQTFVISR